MVFKKNEKFIRAYELTVFFCMVILLVSLVIMGDRQTMSLEMILICVMGPIIMLCILEYAFKGGFFHDIVCCDEHGIKVIMRKTTYDCPWEKIQMLELVTGSRGDIGWLICLYSQENIYIGVVNIGFIRYVKTVAPNVQIKEG